MSQVPPKRAQPPAAGAVKSARQPASVALAIAVTTAGVLPVFLTGALAVQLEANLHVGTTAIGGAVAAFFAASALSSVRGGRIAERIGPFKVMVVAVGGSLAGLLGIGLVVTSFPALLGFLFAGGLSNGILQPAANLLLARVVHDQHQGLAFGAKQAAVPTSTLLSGIAVPAIAVTVGWHAAFLAAAGLAFLVGVFLVLRGHRYMPPTARAGTRAAATRAAGTRAAGAGRAGSRHGVAQGDGKTEEEAALLGDGTGGRRSARSGGRTRASFDPRPLIPLAAAMACGVAAANAMGSFVVPGAVHVGVSPGLAGLVSAAGSIVGLSTRVGIGWRADRKGLRGQGAADAHLKTVAMLIAVGALGYGALAAGTVGLLLPGVVLAYGGGWGYNGLFNLAVVRAYPDSPARATGVTQVGTYLGAMAGPLGFGIIADHFGFDVSWMLCAALAVIAATGFALSRRQLRASFTPAPAGEPGTRRASGERAAATEQAPRVRFTDRGAPESFGSDPGAAH